jgi:GNAT superfamily N-acetyltransferase
MDALRPAWVMGAPDDVRSFAEVEPLRDGTVVTFRAVRPDDRERIVLAFGKLEPETVYSRFFSHKESLSEDELDRIAATDFARNVMLLTTIGDGEGEVVVAAGNYSISDVEPGAIVAEVAFVVEDDYQGRGIASRLLEHLVQIASANGIARFHADVLHGNAAMLGVFARSGLPAHRSVDRGVVRLAMSLPTSH